MKYFGEPYPSREHPAAIYADLEDAGFTPLGGRCLSCEEPIVTGDRGFLIPYTWNPGGQGIRTTIEPIHYECQLRDTVGSVKHQRHECGCFTGDFSKDDDEEYPTRRAAAKAALAEFERRGPWVI